MTRVSAAKAPAPVRSVACLRSVFGPAALCLAATGCVPSPYLSMPDPSYEAALRELSRVRGAGSEPSELFFLQAEAFHQYRPTARVMWPTPQKAAAGCLVPLGLGWLSGAVAGDLGTFELRRRSYIGAAQLFEEYLRREPEGRLAARALYRLGWAYRNVGIGSLLFGGGFRRGADEAFDELARRFPGTAEAARAADARRAPRQDVFQVKVMSGFIPGAGQAVCGEHANAAARFVIALASGTLFLYSLNKVASESAPGRKLSGATLGLGALSYVAVQLSWTTAVWDAERAAIAYNERIETSFHRRHPLPPPGR